MVVPAIAAPQATPGNEGNPGPALGQQPGNAAPPEGDPKPGANPPEPGKGPQEPAVPGSQQDPPGKGDEPKTAPEAKTPPAPQEPPRKTEAEWQAEQRARERQQSLEDWDKKARDLHTKAPVSMRDALDELATKLDVSIPAELRKPLIQLVEDLVEHGARGAELKHADTFTDLKETLEDTSLAFLSQMDDAAMRQKFADQVRGKDPATWVKALLDVKAPSIQAKEREAFVKEQGNLLPEGDVRTAFLEKAGKLSSAKDIAQAFHDSLLGVVGPAGEPRTQIRGGGGGRPTLAEVTKRRSEGYYKSDQEFLADQNLALQGT